MSVYFFRSEPGAAELCRLARRESGWVANSVFISLADVMDACEMVRHQPRPDPLGLRGRLGSGFARSMGGTCQRLHSCPEIPQIRINGKLVCASWKPQAVQSQRRQPIGSAAHKRAERRDLPSPGLHAER
jgi:hypothetical protein